MFTPRDVVWGIVIPALVAALVMAIAWRVWRKGSPIADGNWGGAWAIGVSFTIAFLGLTRRLPNPRQDATDWLFAFAVAGTIFGSIDSLLNIPAWTRRCVAFCSFIVFCWVLLRSVSDLGSGAMVGWIVALALLLSMWWVLLDSLALAERGTIVPNLLTVLAIAIALVLLLSGSQRLGQLGGAFAAAVASCAVVAFFVNSLSLSRGGIFLYVSLGAGLLICGRFYASLTGLNGLLLLAAGLLTVAGHVVPTRLLNGWKRQIGLLAAVIVPAGTAIVLAAREFAANMAEYSY